MAKNGNKKIVYTIDVQLANAAAKVDKLKASVVNLRNAVDASDKRTKKSKKIQDDLAKTRERLTNATKKHTSALIKDNDAHSNSLFAINKHIQALQQENQTLDISSEKFKRNAVEIKNHASKMNQASGATGATTSATMELGRIMSDAPYGIRGVANNISQFTNMMYHASRGAEGLGGALKNIGKDLMGPLGIILAIQAAIALMDYFYGAMKKAEDAAKSFRKSMSESAGEARATTAEMEQYVDSFNEATVGSNEHINALNKLKDEGFDPLTQSAEDFLEVQKKLIILNATKGVFTDELKKLAEEKYLLDQAVSDANKQYLEAQKIADTAKGTGTGSDFGTDKFDRTISLKTEESALDRVLVAENNITEQTTLRAGKMEAMNRSADRYKDLLKEILALTSPDKETGGGGSDPSGVLAKMFGVNALDLDKLNLKNKRAEILAMTLENEEKIKVKQLFARLDLKARQEHFNERETQRKDNFIETQKLRIANNPKNLAIINDANGLIEKAETDHHANMIASEVTYQNSLTQLNKTTDAEDEARAQERNLRDRDRLVQRQYDDDIANNYLKQGRFTVFQDTFDLDMAKLNKEKENLEYRMSFLKEDSEERALLAEQLSDKENEIKVKGAEREMEIEQAKADFRDKMLGHIGAGLGAASKLFKKNSAEAKVFALAEIAVGTAKGLINGLDIAQSTAKESPAAAFTMPIFYASQVAAVLGAAASAKSVLQGGGEGGARASSAAAAPSFTPSFNVVGNSNENQLAQSITNQTNSPTRAYVVYEDIEEAGNVQNESIESSGI